MGEQTYVKAATPISTHAQRPLKLRLDVPFLLITITLLVVGLLMVYSASWDFAVWGKKLPTYYFNRQVIFALGGLILAAIIYLFDYHKLQKYVVPMMIVIIISLLAVKMFGEERYGTTRTLFGGSIQPSEAAKIAVVVYLSYWLYSKRDKLNDITIGLFPMAGILAIIAGLILLQPDLSAAATIVLLGGLMFFLAGGEWKQIVLVVILVSILGILIFTIDPKGQARLDQYIQGLVNPTNASDHIQRTLEAVVRGKLLGVGLGNADTKYTGLPVPHTDSIYAVITEETGLIGAIVTVALYLLFLWRGLKIARSAPDLLGSLIAGGATIWITIEAIINMAVLVNLIPFAGNALPFMSYGGSNLTIILATTGLIMGVARVSTDKELEQGRSFSAVVDMRRRDRRRSVSRARRSRSTLAKE